MGQVCKQKQGKEPHTNLISGFDYLCLYRVYESRKTVLALDHDHLWKELQDQHACAPQPVQAGPGTRHLHIKSWSFLLLLRLKCTFTIFLGSKESITWF